MTWLPCRVTIGAEGTDRSNDYGDYHVVENRFVLFDGADQEISGGGSQHVLKVTIRPLAFGATFTTLFTERAAVGEPYANKPLPAQHTRFRKESRLFSVGAYPGPCSPGISRSGRHHGVRSFFPRFCLCQGNHRHYRQGPIGHDAVGQRAAIPF